jgi:hypothetical protein
MAIKGGVTYTQLSAAQAAAIAAAAADATSKANAAQAAAIAAGFAIGEAYSDGTFNGVGPIYYTNNTDRPVFFTAYAYGSAGTTYMQMIAGGIYVGKEQFGSGDGACSMSCIVPVGTSVTLSTTGSGYTGGKMVVYS